MLNTKTCSSVTPKQHSSCFHNPEGDWPVPLSCWFGKNTSLVGLTQCIAHSHLLSACFGALCSLLGILSHSSGIFWPQILKRVIFCLVTQYGLLCLRFLSVAILSHLGVSSPLVIISLRTKCPVWSLSSIIRPLLPWRTVGRRKSEETLQTVCGYLHLSFHCRNYKHFYEVSVATTLFF